MSGFNLYDYDDEAEQQLTPSRELAKAFTEAKAMSLGLNPQLAMNLINTESGFNPEVIGSSGEVGYGQFMEGTAKALGVNRNIPLAGLSGSLTHYDDLVDTYGTERGTAAYNAGEGALKTGIPESTKNYVAKVTGSPIQRPLEAPPSFDSEDIPPGALPSPSRRLGDKASIQTQIDQLIGAKADALEEIQQGNNLSGNEALVTALTAILPALIGMGLHGSEGASEGLKAGAAGAGVGLAGMALDRKEKHETGKLAYADASKELAAKYGEMKTINDAISDREEKNVETKYNQDRQDNRTNKIAKALAKGSEVPLGEQEKAEVEKFAMKSQNGVNMLDTLNKDFSKMFGNTFRNKDGSFNLEGLAKIAQERGGSLIGAGTEGAKLWGALQQYFAENRLEMTGAASGKEEDERLMSIFTGSGLIAGDLPEIYAAIERSIENNNKKAEKYIDIALAGRSANPKEAIMKTLPKSPPMNYTAPETKVRAARLKDNSTGKYFIQYMDGSMEEEQ